jgi:hypothetical protein
LFEKMLLYPVPQVLGVNIRGIDLPPIIPPTLPNAADSSGMAENERTEKMGIN